MLRCYQGDDMTDDAVCRAHLIMKNLIEIAQCLIREIVSDRLNDIDTKENLIS